RVEAAFSDSGCFERALEKDDVKKMLTPLVGQDVGVVGGLCVPDGIELALEHGALGIKAVFLDLLALVIDAGFRPDADLSAIARIGAALLEQILAQCAAGQPGFE